jgi:serine/threonine protein kinase
MKPDGSYARALLGRRLCGKWHLVRVLGAGGMSTVFEGLHRNGNRAAIKVLHPELAASARLRSRFKREAYVANQIDHPNVVSVLDDDVSEDGLVFLVMEYLEGETLGSRLNRLGAPLAVPDVVTAAIGVLDVLAVAHRTGVIHRDVKPDNIFVTRPERTIKLLDFGIASLRELSAGLSELTGGGAALGTPAFMAPEQARGRAEDVDPTTDLWSLGATMFRLLTGRFVHEEKNAMEVVIASATRSAPSLGSVIDGSAAGLVAIVDRALAFEKAARWPDAESMRAALCALEVHRPGEAFCDEGFLLACEQNTQDESEDPAEPPSMFIQDRIRPPESPAARGKARLLYASATATTLAVATSGWLLQPARQPLARPSATPEVASKTAARPDESAGGAPAMPGDASPAVSHAPAPPALRLGREEKQRAGSSARGTASTASHPEPPPRVERTETLAVPTLDPLDRR